MRKRIFFLQFFLILLIFILPPIFRAKGSVRVDFSRFNFFILPCLAAAAFLYVQDNNAQKGENRLSDKKAAQGQNARQNQDESQDKNARRKNGAKMGAALEAALFLGNVFLAFGFLAATASAVNLLALLFKAQGGETFVFPSGPAQAALCAAALFASAFFEECLYRLYLPQALKKIFLEKGGGARGQTLPRSQEEAQGQNALQSRNALQGQNALQDQNALQCQNEFQDKNARQKKIASFALEAAAVLLFSLAHRYQGFFAVLNALISGAVLRKTVLRSRNVWPSVWAHFLYNALALFLQSL